MATLAPAMAAQGQPAGEPLVRQLYAEVAIEVRRAQGDAVSLAVANADKAIAVTLLARDLRRWADSAGKVLVARTRTRRDSVQWRATVEGPGVEAGSMSLTRSIAPPDTTVSVLFADQQFETVRMVLAASEARAFVAAMRKAADTVLPPDRGRRNAPPPVAPRPLTAGQED